MEISCQCHCSLSKDGHIVSRGPRDHISNICVNFFCRKLTRIRFFVAIIKSGTCTPEIKKTEIQHLLLKNTKDKIHSHELEVTKDGNESEVSRQ